MNYSKTNGFILPSVLLIGLGTLIVGLSLIQTSSSIRSSIDNIYYNKIATETAEAGADYATYCLKANNYQQTWGPAAGRPNLTQSTDCTGATSANTIASLTDTSATNGISSTFSVGDVSRGSDSSYIFSSVSTVTLKAQNASHSVIKSYTNTSRKAVGADAIQFGPVTYGYYPASSGFASDGAFFAVRGSDGNYRVVGANLFGQLGNGTTNNTLSPETYNIPDGSAAISAFSNFVSQGYNLFVISEKGDVWGAGYGTSGQLGNNMYNSSATPVKFILPGGEKGTYVAPNGLSTFVLTDQYNIYAAGYCDQGDLGVGSAKSNCTNVKQPIRVPLPPVNTNDPNTLPTNKIALDNASVFVVMQGGRIYGWGRNAHGELATGNYNNAYTPVQVGTFGNSGQPKAVQIAFDGDTIYVIDDAGNAWAAGRNNWGEMGVNSSTGTFNTFQQVQIPASAGLVKQVATDQWTAVFRTSSGQVWGAGLNSSGELGNNSTTNASKPVQFQLPTGVSALNIYNAGLGDGDTRYNNTFVVGSDGKIYGAGSNGTGQLGTGVYTTYEKVPQAMQLFDGTNIIASDVKTGLGTTVILSKDNIYYTVGNNSYGQLGNGTTQNSNVPAAAEYLRTIPAYIF